MRHPFDLEITDLEAVRFDIEEIADNKAATLIGGRHHIGNNGGIVCISTSCPGSEGGEPIHPPITTDATSETGGELPPLYI